MITRFLSFSIFIFFSFTFKRARERREKEERQEKEEEYREERRESRSCYSLPPPSISSPLTRWWTFRLFGCVWNLAAVSKVRPFLPYICCPLTIVSGPHIFGVNAILKQTTWTQPSESPFTPTITPVCTRITALYALHNITVHRDIATS